MLLVHLSNKMLGLWTPGKPPHQDEKWLHCVILYKAKNCCTGMYVGVTLQEKMEMMHPGLT